MRIIALLASYNEARFIGSCLEHLFAQGLEAYLIDNSSTDRTVEIASRYLGRGLVGIENVPRRGVYSWRPILERKEELAASLDADWFMHCDPDEVRLPGAPGLTLAAALEAADAQGYNAVNFIEFTFIPTRESPDHDHPDFARTMRWYYPFLPAFPHRLSAWKRQPQRVELAWSGGHRVRFPGLSMFPKSFPMRHYLFLSVPHAIEKYVEMRFDERELKAGWFKWRAGLKREMIQLPCQSELRTYTGDENLDPSNPRQQHYLADIVLRKSPA